MRKDGFADDCPLNFSWLASFDAQMVTMFDSAVEDTRRASAFAQKLWRDR